MAPHVRGLSPQLLVSGLWVYGGQNIVAENVSDKMAPATMKGRQRWRSNQGGGACDKTC